MLNLCEKLKNVPRGTKFYTTNWGYVELDDVSTGIKILIDNGQPEYINSNGTFSNLPYAECIIFPSKENRDWDTYSYDPLPIGKPVMFLSTNKVWYFGYYAGNNKVFNNQRNVGFSTKHEEIIPVEDFDFRYLGRKIKKYSY